MDLSVLNDEQLKAVKEINGPIMVMAGAGSGKTRVLTYRIAYLIGEIGIDPNSILAVTFTNKAAREMKDRVASLLDANTSKMWISTFHSFCARFLRKEIGVLNSYRNTFTIIDDDDSLKIIKSIIKEKEYILTPKEALSFISLLKNEESLPNLNSSERHEFDEIYELYQEALLKENLLDFDDLIRLTVEILEKNIYIKEKYNKMFSYIMIDEFQDTNRLQYKLINLLCELHKNIFIVGDINQSIYSFRGARIENVGSFKNKYNPKIIKLEENYRSTKKILDIANDIISKNHNFAKMELFTNGEIGENAKFYMADSNYGECLYITKEINKLVNAGYKYKDIAILYRLNSLSLNFENEFVKNKIPYVIYGGVGYYERKEVKDIIAYLRLILDIKDDFSFKRIVNVPKRKIGEKQIEKLTNYAEMNNLSLFETIPFISNQLLSDFKGLIEELKETIDKCSLDKFLDVLYEKTGYLAMLKNENEDERIDNIMELKSIMKDIMETQEGTNIEKLKNYLLDLALKTDVDNIDENDNKVKLMSFHQAKGLEYPIVFMIAMEQGIFPAFKSMNSNNEMEEERRICYVGVTRARKKLYLTCSHVRRLYGKDNISYPSEFIKDISKNHLDNIGVLAEHRFAPANKNTIKKPVNERVDDKIKIGDKIIHKIFGKGVVVNASDNKITVAFGVEHGIKILIANHPSITRL